MRDQRKPWINKNILLRHVKDILSVQRLLSCEFIASDVEHEVHVGGYKIVHMNNNFLKFLYTSMIKVPQETFI